ncbi:hypothetical protein VNO78_10088 [Psophocarpus tetragonolobus]|uniref:Uncharacterized protein n=1 Tax=Psophocarpus tetragonolobus TaxID=3891 RepID=A0AAN9SQF5_PSOTE
MARNQALLCRRRSIIFVGDDGHIADIPLGFKLSVVDNDFWVSSNGVFAIGFFNIPDQHNQFSVGIRFNSKYIPYSQQIAVWIVCGHDTIGNMSYYSLC